MEELCMFTELILALLSNMVCVFLWIGVNWLGIEVDNGLFWTL